MALTVVVDGGGGTVSGSSRDLHPMLTFHSNKQNKQSRRKLRTGADPEHPLATSDLNQLEVFNHESVDPAGFWQEGPPAMLHMIGIRSTVKAFACLLVVVGDTASTKSMRIYSGRSLGSRRCN